MSSEAFEIVIDRSEKDLFDLVRSRYTQSPACASELRRQPENLPQGGPRNAV